MCQASVQTIWNWLNEIAPFETAESYDNVGLLVGSMHAPVTKIVVALDATPDVIDQAIACKAELIVTHHPLMFRGIKQILTDRYEGAILQKLIKANINLLSAHTNLDQSEEYSGSAALAKALGLKNFTRAGFVFVGDLETPLPASELRKRISDCTQEYTYQYGKEDLMISRLGISGGAYDEGFEQARALGAQAYLTGEVRHHNALAAAQSDFVLYRGGHYSTEAPLIPHLAKALQNALNALKYNVVVYASTDCPYRGRMD